MVATGLLAALPAFTALSPAVSSAPAEPGAAAGPLSTAQAGTAQTPTALAADGAQLPAVGAVARSLDPVGLAGAPTQDAPVALAGQRLAATPPASGQSQVTAAPGPVAPSGPSPTPVAAASLQAPFKTVSVPGTTITDVAVDADGDILVAGGERLYVYLSVGLYIGSISYEAPIRNLATGAGSVFVHIGTDIVRLDGVTLQTLGTYPDVGRLEDQPIAGNELVYLDTAGNAVRVSLTTGARQTWTPPAGRIARAVFGRPGSAAAVLLTAPSPGPGDLELTGYDLAGATPTAGTTLTLPAAGGSEPVLGLSAGGNELLVRTDATTVTRVALPLSALGTNTLSGSYPGTATGAAVLAVTAGNGGWELVAGADTTQLFSFVPAGQAAAVATTAALPPGQFAAWNLAGTQLAVARPASAGAPAPSLSLYTAPGGARPTTAFSGAAGEYRAVAPVRALDTREAIGTASRLPLGPRATVEVSIAGLSGLPASHIAAVAVNITAVTPTEPTYLTAYPSGYQTPAVSNVNATASAIRPNLAIVRVGDNGRITLYNAAGQSHAIVDVLGYFSTADGAAGGRFHALEPQRLLDTRTEGPLGPDQLYGLAVRGRGGVPSGARAVAITLTAVAPTEGTFVVAWPSDEARPLASNLNPTPGSTVANLVFTGIGADGNIALYNAAGSTHVVVDVVGYWDDDRSTEAGRYIPYSRPFRYYDSRRDNDPMLPGWLRSLRMAGWPTSSPIVPVPSDGAMAVAYNLTATNTTAGGYLTAYPGPLGTIPPWASNLNFAAGETVASLAVTGFGADGQVSFYNPAGQTDLVADMAGFFTSPAF